MQINLAVSKKTATFATSKIINLKHKIMEQNIYFPDKENLKTKAIELIDKGLSFKISELKITILKTPNANIFYKTKNGEYQDKDIFSEHNDIAKIAANLYEIEEVKNLLENECEILGIIKKNTYNTTVK